MPLIDLVGPVIDPGESLSRPLDCAGGTILRITIPPNWTPANLSFQIATQESGPFSDLFDVSGDELIVPANAGTTVLVKNQPPGALMAMAWIKIRSGGRDYPVPQAGPAPAVFRTTLQSEQEAPPVEPETSTAPENVTPPVVFVDGGASDTCSVGSTLSADTGVWTVNPATFWYSWLADSELIGNGALYVTHPADSGRTIVCAVTASNAVGSGNALSNTVLVTDDAP